MRWVLPNFDEVGSSSDEVGSSDDEVGSSDDEMGSAFLPLRLILPLMT